MPSRLVTSLCMGTALLGGMLLSALTCSSTLPPGQVGSSGTPCTYPRGCYVVQKDGPLAGQCSDCAGGPEHCRLYFVPTPGLPSPLDLGGVFISATADLSGVDLSGVTLPDRKRGPAITDAPVVCNLYPGALADDQQAACTTVSTLCIARGPRCADGYCVHAGESCDSDSAISPQRKPGMAASDLYCPYTDDVCCALTPDGGLPDGRMPDGGFHDAAPATDAQRG